MNGNEIVRRLAMEILPHISRRAFLVVLDRESKDVAMLRRLLRAEVNLRMQSILEKTEQAIRETEAIPRDIDHVDRYLAAHDRFLLALQEARVLEQWEEAMEAKLDESESIDPGMMEAPR
ncbi:MAG: hypothetical protein AB1824_01370 [Acidobacteriota bacterium]